MGCWDCFCAICGGPFFGIEISEEPRSARFLERRAKEIENQRLEREGPRHKADDAEGDDDDGERDSHESDDEDRTYDRDVVSAEDVQWAATLHVLALNPDSEREKRSVPQMCDRIPSAVRPYLTSQRHRAFVSGPGSYGDYGRVSVESGYDPNAEGADLTDASCYDDVDSQCGPLFPFHWCCYEMLVKHITGSPIDSGLDKDLLYAIMDSLSPGSGGPLADLDYGDAGDMQSQFWEIVAGYEYLVSNPRKVPAAAYVVSSMFSLGAFKTRSSCTDLESLVRVDPFMRLPYDIIYKISGFISDEEVVNLARASWPVHSLLRDNSQFWRHRLRASLPWFSELWELLEQDQTLWQSNNAQLIFQWAERMTRPRKWLTGPLMGVANRRRIWSVCEQLGEIYWSEKEEQEQVSVGERRRTRIRRFPNGPSLVIRPFSGPFSGTG